MNMRHIFSLLLAVTVFGLPAGLARGQSADATSQPSAGSLPADRDYYMANHYFQARKWLDAADEFARFVRTYPGEKRAADAQFGHAQSLYYLGRYQPAIESFQLLLETYPQFDKAAAALFQLGHCHWNTGQLDKAIEAFGQVSSRHATHYLAEWADAMAAGCLISQKQYVKAEALLLPLIGRYVTGEQAGPRLAERQKELAAINTQLVDSFADVLANAHLNLAMALHGQGKDELAAAEFSQFLARHPGHKLAGTAQFHLAQTLFNSGKFAESAAMYDKVISGKGPMAEPASFNKALAIYRAGELSKAAAAFIEAAKDYPQSERAGRARLYAGNCLFESGDYEAAIRQFDALINERIPVAPDEARYWKGQAQLKLGLHADAAATFAAAVKAHPDSPQMPNLLLGQADALLAQNDLAESAAVYQQVASRFPRHESAGRALYNAAQALHKGRRFDESNALCDKFLADHPNDPLAPRVLFIAGQNRFGAGNYAAAVPLYRQKLERFPGDGETEMARLRLGWALYFQKQYSQAIPVLEAIGADGDRKIRQEAIYLKANCLLELKNDDEAAAAFEAYVAQPTAVGPDGTPVPPHYADDAMYRLALIRLGQKSTDKAVASLERLVSEHPNSQLRAQAEYLLAEQRFVGRKFHEAIGNYQEVLARDPKGTLAPYAAFGIGLCHAELGNWKEAANAYANVINYAGSESLLPQAMFRQGLCFQELEQWAVAEKVFSELVAKHPQDRHAAPALRAIGRGLGKLKNFERAAVVYTRLINDYPTSSDIDSALYELAWCYREMDDKERMLAVFGQLAEKFPNSPLAPDAYYYLAEQHYQNKQYDKALALYQSCAAAAKDDSRKAMALYRLAWCYWLVGRYEDAAERFDKIINELPASDLRFDALLNAGEAYLRAGKPSAAADRLTRLVDAPEAKNYKHLPDAMRLLGETCIDLGQHDKALATFKAVRDRFPGNADPAVDYGIGRAQFELKQYNDAIRTLTLAIESPRLKDELAAKCQFYLAEAYFAASQLPEARKGYTRVTVIFSAWAQWSAASYYQLGQVSIEQARRVAADNPQAAQILRSEAVGHFQSVIDRYPTSKWADPARKMLTQLKD